MAPCPSSSSAPSERCTVSTSSISSYSDPIQSVTKSVVWDDSRRASSVSVSTPRTSAYQGATTATDDVQVMNSGDVVRAAPTVFATTENIEVILQVTSIVDITIVELVSPSQSPPSLSRAVTSTQHRSSQTLTAFTSATPSSTLEFDSVVSEQSAPRTPTASPTSTFDSVPSDQSTPSTPRSSPSQTFSSRAAQIPHTLHVATRSSSLTLSSASSVPTVIDSDAIRQASKVSILGVVVGAVLTAAMVVSISIFFLIRRRRRSRNMTAEANSSSPTTRITSARRSVDSGIWPNPLPSASSPRSDIAVAEERVSRRESMEKQPVEPGPSQSRVSFETFFSHDESGYPFRITRDPLPLYADAIRSPLIIPTVPSSSRSS